MQFHSMTLLDVLGKISFLSQISISDILIRGARMIFLTHHCMHWHSYKLNYSVPNPSLFFFLHSNWWQTFLSLLLFCTQWKWQTHNWHFMHSNYWVSCLSFESCIYFKRMVFHPNNLNTCTKIQWRFSTQKQVSIPRKCHNHTLQINRRHREEEKHNTYSHISSRRQLK